MNLANAEIHHIQDGKVTVVSIEFKAWLGDNIVVGHAICHPDDEFDYEVGFALAFGRALADAAKYFKSIAWDRVPK